MLSPGDDNSQAGNAVSDAGIDKAAPVLDQQKAVAGSLDHITGNVVTAAKGHEVTDPEQAFSQSKWIPIPLCVSHCCCNGRLTCNMVSCVALGFLVHSF